MMTIEKILQSAFANKSRLPPLCAVTSVQPCSQGCAAFRAGPGSQGSWAAGGGQFGRAIRKTSDDRLGQVCFLQVRSFWLKPVSKVEIFS
jgi:hypothetical protein